MNPLMTAFSNVFAQFGTGGQKAQNAWEASLAYGAQTSTNRAAIVAQTQQNKTMQVAIVAGAAALGIFALAYVALKK